MRLPLVTNAIEVQPPLGVVGLWHLGCVITAAWLQRDRRVLAFDPEGNSVLQIRNGRAPVREAGLDETLAAGIRSGALQFPRDPQSLADCRLIFIAYDSIVRDDDSTDLSEVENAIDVIGVHAAAGSIVIVSAQLPVGSARLLRARLQARNPSLELVYVPENLRLGEAMQCYLDPGYTVIGAASDPAATMVDRLFAELPTQRMHMTLESAELVKHAINSFLATSISLANHWSDVAEEVAADYPSVERALRADPRIGRKAYVSPGLGFSGGTLGRDMRVLERLSRGKLDGSAPLFEAVLSYNADRAQRLVARVADFVAPSSGRVAVLGVTYKPGTSTLRRSRPLEVAWALAARGVAVSIHDPGADWSESATLEGLTISKSPYDAAQAADVILILTGWPEYRVLDLTKLASGMRKKVILDPGGVLRTREAELSAAGFLVSWSTLIPHRRIT